MYVLRKKKKNEEFKPTQQTWLEVKQGSSKELFRGLLSIQQPKFHLNLIQSCISSVTIRISLYPARLRTDFIDGHILI